VAYERESREAVALKSLQSKRYPDANKDFQKNMRRLNGAVDYISGTLGQMQKGIDDANKNFIEQIQDFIADIIVLFAGGEPTGIEFGDLKYIFQAIGALFGLNGPFPISLIEAAFHFFFGFVVPTEQFTDLIFDTIFAWAENIGLPESFITDLHELADAFGEISETVGELLTSLTSLFDIFGIFDGDFGIFGALWDAIFGLFDGIDTSGFSSILDLVTGVMSPFIDGLTFIVDIVNSILDAFSGGLTDLAGILNFGKMFEDIDFLAVIFDPIEAIINFISGLIGDFFSLGSIGNKETNLVRNPLFTNTSIVDGYTGWTIDSTTKHSDTGNSVKVIADGTLKELPLSKIRVSDKQRVVPKIWVSWSGLVSTGSPISIVLNCYSEANELLNSVVVDSAVISGANSSWVELTDEYVTPELDYVIPVLRVAATATAGTVRFSDASVIKKIAQGVAPIDWVIDLPDLINGISEFIQNVIMVIMEVITGIPFIGWIFDDLKDALDDWFNDTQTTAGRADDAWGWVHDIWNTAFQGWNNDNDAIGRTIEDFLDIFKQSRRYQTELAAAIAALEKDRGAGASSGTSYDIKIPDWNPSFPSVFTKFYDEGAGNVAFDSSDDGVLQFTNNTGLELYRHNNGDMLTDYPKVSLLLTRQTLDYVGAYGDRSVWWVSRLNAANTEGIVCRLRGRSVQIGYVKVGTHPTNGNPIGWGNVVWLGSPVDFINVGSYMSFAGGTTQVNPRQLQFLVNGLVKATFTDATAASILGSNNRGWGWGLQHQAGDAINRSARIGRILTNDNYPPTIPGTYGRMNRLATANIGVTSGVNPFPTSFFGNTAESSPDVGVDPTNASFTLKDAGLYDFRLRVKAGSSETSHMEFLLYLNGVPWLFIGGDQMFGSTAVGSTILTNSYFASSGPVPVPANAVVKIAYRSSATTINVFTGEASGFETYFSTAKVAA
jgi:hypothetical protein